MAIRVSAAWWVFALAFGLRFAVAVALPNVHQPDEIFQAFEQAHRVVFGSGLVPWEYRLGARSWLMPGLLMGPMWISKWLAPASEAYRPMAQALLAALSASSATVAWSWGRRTSRLHAVLAALVLAIWFEFVYFGAKAFSEVVAAAFLFAATFLCTTDPARRETRFPLLAGLCLGAAMAFRFHLAPAALLIGLWGGGSLSPAQRLRLVLGICLPVALLGCVDFLTWGAPFASVIRNYTANITAGVSQRYGTSGADWYLTQLLLGWGPAALVLLGLALWRARKQALPLLVAVVVVLSHSLVAHKEYRFIYPALPMLLFLAAEGSADVCQALGGRLVATWSAARWGLILAVAWLVLSASLSVSGSMLPGWYRARAGLELLSAAREKKPCGVAISGPWSWTGGYSSLHVDVPMHLLWEGNRKDWDPRAFTAWFGPAGWEEPRGSGFVMQRCAPEFVAGMPAACLWTRPGRCEAHPVTEAQRQMESWGD